MSFVRNVGKLASGAVLAQAINILFVPVLSRVFPPDAFGIHTLYLSFTTVLLIFFTGGYEHAILVDEKDGDAWALVRILSVASAGIALFLVLTLMIVEYLLDFPWLQEHVDILYVAVFGSGLMATSQVFYYWENRQQGYAQMAKSRLVSAVGVNLASLGAWWFGVANGWGLISGHLVGSGLALGYLITHSLRQNRHRTLHSSDAGVHLLRKYLVYPKYLIASTFIDRLSNQLHIFMISSFWGNTAAGYIGMYRRVAGLPSSLIGSAVGEVFRERASNAFQTRGQCRELFRNVTFAMSAIALIPTLCLVIAGPTLFALVLGPEWREAGVYAQYLAPMFFLSLVVSPLSTVIYLRQATHVDLLIQCSLLVSISVGLLLVKELGTARSAVGVFGLIYCVKYCVEYIISFRLSSFTDNNLQKSRAAGHRSDA